MIQLPPDLFFGTTIATCIIVLKKSQDRQQDAVHRCVRGVRPPGQQEQAHRREPGRRSSTRSRRARTPTTSPTLVENERDRRERLQHRRLVLRRGRGHPRGGRHQGAQRRDRADRRPPGRAAAARSTRSSPTSKATRREPDRRSDRRAVPERRASSSARRRCGEFTAATGKSEDRLRRRRRRFAIHYGQIYTRLRHVDARRLVRSLTAMTSRHRRSRPAMSSSQHQSRTSRTSARRSPGCAAIEPPSLYARQLSASGIRLTIPKYVVLTSASRRVQAPEDRRVRRSGTKVDRRICEVDIAQGSGFPCRRSRFSARSSRILDTIHWSTGSRAGSGAGTSPAPVCVLPRLAPRLSPASERQVGARWARSEQFTVVGDSPRRRSASKGSAASITARSTHTTEPRRRVSVARASRAWHRACALLSLAMS